MASWLHRRGLRTKIVAWSFIPTVIILSAVALVSIAAYQRGAEALVLQRNREVARLLAGQIDAELAKLAATLTQVSRTSDVYDGVPSRQRSALKQAAERLAVFDAGVIILDKYGVISASEPERADIAAQDWSARSSFRSLVRSTAAHWSDISNDGPLATPVVAVAVPISGSRGEFVGAMLGLLSVRPRADTTLHALLSDLLTGIGAAVLLVDSSGVVLYHSDPQQVGADFAHVEAVRAVMKGRGDALRTHDVTGRDIVAAFSPVGQTAWGLVAEESWDALTSPSQGYQRFLLFLLSLGVAIPSLVVAVGVQRISRPISDLIIASRAVAGGSFGFTITANTGDEIEELARQFNIMSAELAQSYADLERRVADRTRDLQTLNAIGTVVSGSLDLQAILGEALRKTIEATGMECGAAYVLDADGALHSMARQGLSDDFAQQTAHLPAGSVLLGRGAAGRGTVVWSPSLLPDADLQQKVAAEGLVFIVAVPLTAKGELVGALVLGNRSSRQMSEDEKALLDGIGRQVGMAVENARLYRRAEEVAVVAERQRLARELHDAVTQTLFSASLIADVLPRLWQRNPAEAGRRLAELRELTRGALAEMRTLLHELRPASLTEMPLGDLLRQLAEATTGRSRIPVSVTVESQCPLPPHVQVTLYRIAQEALNNVAKHSGASAVQVVLRCQPGPEGQSRGVELCVQDDGCGFDVEQNPPSGHLGLGIMHERALGIGARIRIDSAPGKGTRVAVSWPE